jgi:3-hydroxybutyryl-CoA dehydratase
MNANPFSLTPAAQAFNLSIMNSAAQASDWVGRSAARTVRITEAMVDDFARLSGDACPLHMTDAAARQAGFTGRVVHGLFLGSLVSSVLGLQLPGEDGLLQNIQLSFRNPCYVCDEIQIRVEAVEFFESVQTVALKIRITRSNGDVLCTGEATCGIRSKTPKNSGDQIK